MSKAAASRKAGLGRHDLLKGLPAAALPVAASKKRRTSKPRTTRREPTARRGKAAEVPSPSSSTTSTNSRSPSPSPPPVPVTLRSSSPKNVDLNGIADIPSLRSKPVKGKGASTNDMFELVWSKPPSMTPESIEQFLISMKSKLMGKKKLVSVHNAATNQQEAAIVLSTGSMAAHPRMAPSESSLTVNVHLLQSGHQQTEPLTRVVGPFSEDLALQCLQRANFDQGKAFELLEEQCCVQLHEVHANMGKLWTSKDVDQFQAVVSKKHGNLNAAKRQLRRKEWGQLIEEYYRTLHDDDPFASKNEQLQIRRSNCFFCGGQGSYVMMCLTKTCSHAICRSCCRDTHMKCLDLGQWAVQQSHLSWVCPECCTVDQIAESSTEKEPIEEEPTEEEMLLKSLEMLASDIAAEKRPAPALAPADPDTSTDIVTQPKQKKARKSKKGGKRGKRKQTKKQELAHEFVGQEIEHGGFKGTVVNHRRDEKQGEWFTVEYQDGDREDFAFQQIKNILEGGVGSSAAASTAVSSEDDVQPVSSTSEDSAGELDGEQSNHSMLVPHSFDCQSKTTFPGWLLAVSAQEDVGRQVAPLRSVGATQLSKSLPSFASRFSC